jgi:hypothetical protein
MISFSDTKTIKLPDNLNKQTPFFGQIFIHLTFYNTNYRMPHRLAIALVLTFCISSLMAQSDQYMVKLNGDTIRGKLQINPARDNSQSMYFKHEDGSKENIRPIRISYVYYSDQYQFRSVPFYNQRLFMQIVKEDRNLSNYNYIHKRDNSIATTKVVVKPGGEVLELSALTFRKQITEFLQDCPKVVAMLEAKQYKYKDQHQLFEDYNNCDTQAVTVDANTNADANTDQTVTSYSSNPAQTTAADVTTATGAGSVSVTPGSKENKLSKIDNFRKYVRGLDNFQHSRDVLEWLTDVEYRVSQGREIPNYLWSSLNAMTSENPDLQDKADLLQKDLGN